ncbi:MAG TPA: sn-glycerol-3-phosphate ABC transporter ATP-binding protein UgpC [Roseiarcus sp.]|nr:sn-glycerol-3-phosphate ABC transporter ATP-binding protein UgpC [Roseiarcus sp.]
MPQIVFENVSKRYSEGFYAVRSLDLTVQDGEFLVLVGPSGCGKSTALRMVAGLEDVSEGKIHLGGVVANDLSPRERNIAMVFQSYALYPHLTVAENIAFGLKVRGASKADIAAKVAATAEILELSPFLGRKPAQLSGGQRQRVAMGRAIVRAPQAFLMDEPLSNLDARLRVQMRVEIARIQKMTGVTTIYVTHDQVEAMTMGDRVAVMNHGVLQQLAPPRVLYHEPANLFVASFIGSPAINLVEGRILGDGGGSYVLELGDARLRFPDSVVKRKPAIADCAGRKVTVGLRPETLSLDASGGSSKTMIEGRAAIVEDLGASLLVHFDAASLFARPGGLAQDAEADDLNGAIDRGRIRAMVDGMSGLRVGDRAPIAIDLERAHLFDPETGLAIGSATH